jgi:hypothetical protein
MLDPSSWWGARSLFTSRMSCSRPVASLFRMRSSLEITAALNLAFDDSLNSIFPGRIEADAIDGLQNVDPCGWLADLEGGAIRKVRGSQTFDRRSVLRQRSEYRLAVLFIRTDKNVQVFGCAWLCVYGVTLRIVLSVLKVRVPLTEKLLVPRGGLEPPQTFRSCGF